MIPVATKSICGWQFEKSLPPAIVEVPFEQGELESHYKYMRKAINLSSSAEENGNHPFGALLVYEEPNTKERKVLLFSENTVNTDQSALCHGESNLCRLVQINKISKEVLKNSTLYTSAEPCAMCCGAIFWSGIREVAYGAPHDSFGSASFRVPCREVFKFARQSEAEGKNEAITVIGPVLSEEAVPIVQKYFA